MTGSDRLTCVCPGCRRTTARDGIDEWICSRHWGAISRSMRRRYALYRRRARRDARWRPVTTRMWQRCRAAAINEALTGLIL